MFRSTMFRKNQREAAVRDLYELNIGACSTASACNGVGVLSWAAVETQAKQAITNWLKSPTTRRSCKQPQSYKKDKAQWWAWNESPAAAPPPPSLPPPSALSGETLCQTTHHDRLSSEM